MKKTTIFLSVIMLTYSCANNNNNTQPAETIKNEPGDTTVLKGLQLVANSDCVSCHQINEALTGPAYKAIANKYALRKNIADTLADKIIKGGAGNWGQVPMTPHPSVDKEDAKAMVSYILSLKE